MCFQLLGFDVMLTDDLRPYLLEVNQMPSFQTDSPLDDKIKRSVIMDTLKMLGLSRRRRYKGVIQKKRDFERRILSKFSIAKSRQSPQRSKEPQPLKKIHEDRNARRKRNFLRREKVEQQT
jgi:hypothetical protein